MANNRITYGDELVLRNGKVGIGTTNPEANLSVFGSLDVSGELKIVSAGNTEGEIITQKHYKDNGGSIVYQKGDQQLFSVSNEGDLAYVINDSDGNASLEVTKSGVTTISNQQQGELKFLSVGSSESTRISAKHYSNNNGSVAYQSGDSHLFSIDKSDDGIFYSINDLEARPALTVSNNGITTVRDLYQNTINFTSVGATSTENIQIKHFRNIAYKPAVGIATNNRGAVSFESIAGVSTDNVTIYPSSLLAIDNDPLENVLSVSGYNFWSGSPGTPAIDVTRLGRVGLGTTNPSIDIDIARQTYFTGPNFVFRNQAQIQDKLILSEVLNPGLTSTTSVTLEPYTPGITTLAPSRGSSVFRGELDQSLNGGQLFTVVNDNNSIFTINRFVGLSSLTPAPVGQRNIETVFQVLSNGNIGIGTTNPVYEFDVQKNLRIRNNILLSSQNSPTLDNTIFATPVSTGINTASPVNGSFVLSKNQKNSGANSSQLFTVENDDNCNFRINLVGIAQTYLPTGQVPIFPAFDISNYGEVKIFDTLTKAGDTFNPLPTGISTLAKNDADLFRIDSYAPTFIGSFPTINPAIKINKFGYTEIYRNINQVSGITTVGIATTTPTLNVNATLSFELVNNTTLAIKVRGTDGVTRSGIVTLS